jgi:hypothetical protein
MSLLRADINLPKIAQLADRPATGLLLFVATLPLILLIYFPTPMWHPNEEHYFLLAHQYFAPEKYHALFAAFDSTKTRFVFNYPVGALIDWLGYEQARGIVRILMAGLYAVAFAFFFRTLRLSVLDSLLILVAYVLANQTFFAEEWLLDGVEGKTFAYACVLAAFGFLHKDRFDASVLLLAVGTYFHFLVGGAWFAFLAALYVLYHGKIPSWRHIALYVVCVAPLVAIVIIGHGGNVPRPEGISFSADYIYSVLRNPHHVAPFSSRYLLWQWTTGIVLLGCFLVVSGCLYWFGGLSDRTRALTALVGLGLLYLVAALIVSFIDRNTGAIGKFYVFRPASFLFLLGIVTVALFIREKAPINTDAAKLIVAMIMVPICFWIVAKAKIEQTYFQGPTRAKIAAVAAAVQQSTPADAVILTDPALDMTLLALPRKLERPTLVHWKFVPSNPREIYEWYRRLQFRSAVFERGCGGRLDFPVAYILAQDTGERSVLSRCGTRVQKIDDLVLWRVGG